MKICKCGNPMKYLVGNSGLQAHHCIKCGRAALTDGAPHDEVGEEVNAQWFEPEYLQRTEAL